MNAIKLNLVDFEVVKELRKIDGKLIIFGLGMAFLLCENMALNKRVKRLEDRLDDLAIKHNNLAEDFADSLDKEKSKED